MDFESLIPSQSEMDISEIEYTLVEDLEGCNLENFLRNELDFDPSDGPLVWEQLVVGIDRAIREGLVEWERLLDYTY